MAKFIFAMNQSLDGYVDHTQYAPDRALFRHWIEQVQGVSGSIYGRVIYDIMRYWDEERTDWDAEETEFAIAWRAMPKWVVSRTLKSVGPNATLISDNVEAALRDLKARQPGEIAVAGPRLAHYAGELTLIDEYRLYMCPVVLGKGTPFFAGPRPPMRFVSSDIIGKDTVRLVYATA